MKSAGFNEADIGADSVCDEILQSLGKSFTYPEVLKASEILKKEKMPVTWFIMLGARNETRETVIESLDTIGKIASQWDLVFVSTGIRVYNGAPIASQIVKSNGKGSPDNFLRPVKIDPEGISLEEIHAITKEYSSRFPNFYFYEKNSIIPGWLLITGNTLLKIFHSRQPVWRLLILLRKIEKTLGITLVKKTTVLRAEETAVHSKQGVFHYKIYAITQPEMKKVTEKVYSRMNYIIYDLDSDTWWKPDTFLNLIKTVINPVRVGYAKRTIENILKTAPGKIICSGSWMRRRFADRRICPNGI